MTLQDIGGGVGVIQHELLKAGISQVTSVEASKAYDRVICCYDYMQGLVSLSARAREYYALAYPRDSWWMKVFGSLKLSFSRQTMIWRVKVFVRTFWKCAIPYQIAQAVTVF